MNTNQNPAPNIPKDFLEKHPHLKDFMGFLYELNSESPRGSVLASCGYLEELLKEILLAFMLKNKVAEELVGDGLVPLGSFSARTQAAYVLGLISENEFKELNNLRKIRNLFAHKVKMSFEVQKVKDLCSNLIFSAKDYGEVRMSAHGQFSTAATSLILNLVNRPHYVGQKAVRYEEWPY